MPMFKLPLSGDVTRTINPWTAIFSPTGGQLDPVNVFPDQSSALSVEADVLTDGAGDDKQLGLIGDAMRVVLKYLPEDADLSHLDRAIIKAPNEMLVDMDAVKRRHDRQERAF